jgi:hypothetical protein
MFENAETIALWSAIAGGSIAAATFILTIFIGRVFDERRERRKLVFETASKHYERIIRGAENYTQATGEPVDVQAFDEFIIYADQMCRIVEGSPFSESELRSRFETAKVFSKVTQREAQETKKENQGNPEAEPKATEQTT